MASGTGIGEFFVSLTVDAASGALTVGNLVQSFGELELATIAEIGALWQMGIAMARMVDEGMKLSLGFEQFTMHTDMSAQALQRWQRVAELSHASASDVTSSVESLSKSLSNLELGKSNPSLESFQRMGVNFLDAKGHAIATADALDLIRKHLGEIQGGARQQENVLAGLGISANLRETMLLSDRVFDERAGSAHGMTEAQEKSFDNMRQHMVRIHLIAQDIGRDIGSWIADLDRATGALSKVEGFFKGIRDVLEGKLKLPQESDKQKGIDAQERSFVRSIFNLNPGDISAHDQLAGWMNRMFGSSGVALPPEPAGGFRTAAPDVTVNYAPTYNIHDATNPAKVKDIIDKDFPEMIKRHVIDQFDQYNTPHH